jgi:hypothetical protein
MYEHLLRNDYNHKYDKQVTMFFSKLFKDFYGVEHLPKMNHHTMHSPKEQIGNFDAL